MKVVIKIPKKEGQIIAKADLDELIYAQNKLEYIKGIIEQRGITQDLNNFSRIWRIGEDAIGEPDVLI